MSLSGLLWGLAPATRIAGLARRNAITPYASAVFIDEVGRGCWLCRKVRRSARCPRSDARRYPARLCRTGANHRPAAYRRAVPADAVDGFTPSSRARVSHAKASLIVTGDRDLLVPRWEIAILKSGRRLAMVTGTNSAPLAPTLFLPSTTAMGRNKHCRGRLPSTRITPFPFISRAGTSLPLCSSLRPADGIIELGEPRQGASQLGRITGRQADQIQQQDPAESNVVTGLAGGGPSHRTPPSRPSPQLPKALIGLLGADQHRHYAVIGGQRAIRLLGQHHQQPLRFARRFQLAWAKYAAIRQPPRIPHSRTSELPPSYDRRHGVTLSRLPLSSYPAHRRPTAIIQQRRLA